MEYQTITKVSKTSQQNIQICELTGIEEVSPTFQDSNPHENVRFISPALPMLHPHSVIVK